jgi:hypothetical protein
VKQNKKYWKSLALKTTAKSILLNLNYGTGIEASRWENLNLYGTKKSQWYNFTNITKSNLPYLSTGSAEGDLMYEEILSKVLTMYSFTWIKNKNHKPVPGTGTVSVLLWKKKADQCRYQNNPILRFTLKRIRI